jgi:NADH-quinone oxidoreductase subunit E
MTAENTVSSTANHSPELPGTAELPGAPIGYPPDALRRLEADAAVIVSRYPQARSALLPLLHLVQSEDGFITQRGVELCARLLDLSTAEVAGVATFYTQYKRHPNGEYTVGVCTNTLCAIMGGDALFDALSDHLDIGHDETTDDGRITLERLECNAACDYAPVMMVNWEFFDNQTPASARAVVDDLRAGVPVRPSRGPSRVCTFKQVSRTLAGFPDGLADEGVGAGAASLEGLRLARRNGWTAPSPATADGGGEAPVEQVAAEQAASPANPSANEAALKGQTGDEARTGAAHQKED